MEDVQFEGALLAAPPAPSAPPLALYRRYRPDTFAQVIGQEHVTEPLQRALVNNRVNHAYLFSGPRGCGKTTSARILARALNCIQAPVAEPCGVCESCRDLATGGPGSIDVIEIDAASHGGVDDARDLRERAFFSPVSSRFKIYIVDEAHMVTTAGFNALLKLVEEPPPHVKFIFATTEPDKVIGTIRSRTHHYPFRLVPPRVLTSYLGTLCEAEGIQVETGVLPLVVRAGAGSVRDSLSVLDQLLGGAAEEGVSYRQAAALLGYTPESLLDEMLDAFAAGDSRGVFAGVDKVIEVGQDPRRFAEDLLRRLRDLVIVAAVPDALTSGLVDVAADQADRLSSQAAALGPGELTRAAEVIAAGLTEMRGTTAPRLHLELMCARVLLPGTDVDDRGIHARLDRLERRIGVSGAAVPIQQSGPAQVVNAEPGRSPAEPTRSPAELTPTPAEPAQMPGEQIQTPGGPAQGSAVPAAGPEPDRQGHEPSADDEPSASPPAGPVAAPADAGTDERPAAAAAAHGSVPAEAARTDLVPRGSGQSGAAQPESAQSSVVRPESAPRPEAQSSGQTTTQPSAEPSGMSLTDVRRLWPEVLEEVKGRRRFTWILLSQNAQVAEVRAGTLVLAMPNAGVRENFSRGGSEDILREAMVVVLGTDFAVETIIDLNVAGGGGRPPGESRPADQATAGPVPGAAFSGPAGQGMASPGPTGGPTGQEMAQSATPAPTPSSAADDWPEPVRPPISGAADFGESNGANGSDDHVGARTEGPGSPAAIDPRDGRRSDAPGSSRFEPATVAGRTDAASGASSDGAPVQSATRSAAQSAARSAVASLRRRLRRRRDRGSPRLREASRTPTRTRVPTLGTATSTSPSNPARSCWSAISVRRSSVRKSAHRLHPDHHAHPAPAVRVRRPDQSSRPETRSLRAPGRRRTSVRSGTTFSN